MQITNLIFLFSSLIFSLCSHAQMYDDITAEIAIGRQVGGKKMFSPGSAIPFEYRFFDSKTGELFLDYKVMHGKLMHMVLLKDDLSVFKHIHPYYDPVTGRFHITTNVALADPDNFHNKNALTEPGHYHLMADVEIKGLGMRMAMDHLMIKGESTPRPLTLSKKLTPNSYRQYFTKASRPVSNPAKAAYKGELKFRQQTGCDGEMVHFDFVLKKKNQAAKFEEITTIKPWLSMGLHAVWVSAQMEHGHGKMPFAHMHAELPYRRSDFFFNYYNKGNMNPGLQKIWLQVKDGQKVLTLPFVFEYKRNPIEPSSC